MTTRPILFSVVLCALPVLLAAQTAEAAPQCAVIAFLDKNGNPVATPKPVIGAVIGDRLVIEKPGPSGTTLQAGTPAPCPASLVAHITSTFKKSCTTIQQRIKTAQANKISRQAVDQNCDQLESFVGPTG